MSYDYAQRRPYANPITLGGYRSADREAAPAANVALTTPADALRFLASHVGYDDPVSSPKYNGAVPGAAPLPAVSAHGGGVTDPLTGRQRPLSATAGRRLPALSEGAPGFLVQHDAHDGPQTTSSVTDGAATVRHPQKPSSALAKRSLAAPAEGDDAATTTTTTAPALPVANPIELNDTAHYHTSQQNALNAQLRGEVERLLSDWIARLTTLQNLVDGYPKECALTNFGTTEAAKTYLRMYSCTDVPTLPRDELAARHSLQTTRDDLTRLESLPPLSLEGVQRALDNLLNAKALLTHSLDDHHRALRVLDAFAATEMILPSSTAVALHERHYYAPGEYALLELRKSQVPLDKMEERVETARVQKERAIDEKKPGVALGNLHAQADYANDLLLLNKARMTVVAQHADDVREYRIDITQLIKDAKEACEAFHNHVAPYIPKLNHDMRALQDGAQTARSALTDMEENERREEAKMCGALLEVDKEEQETWNQLRELLRRLHTLADKKDKLVKDRLSRREMRGREFAAVEQLLKAQEEELERQLQCHEIAHRWMKTTELYDAYVEAYVPKLLMDINKAESEHEQLEANESEEYVRRYELFTYAAEEARAKRNVQLDRMRLTERTLNHTLSVAPDAMDPDVESTERRLALVREEAQEAQAYVEYMMKLEDDRRAEVEPYLERLMARVVADNERHTATHLLPVPPMEALTRTTASTSDTDAGQATPAPSTDDVFRSVSPGGTVSSSKRGTVARALALYPDEKDDSHGEASELANVTVTHPHLAARSVGLQHELNHLDKHRHLVDEELNAVDAQRDGVRRSRKQLSALEEKYKNAEDIRALLGV